MFDFKLFHILDVTLLCFLFGGRGKLFSHIVCQSFVSNCFHILDVTLCFRIRFHILDVKRDAQTILQILDVRMGPHSPKRGNPVMTTNTSQPSEKEVLNIC